MVLPSITTRTFKEPWGLVVNEAFNQGVPVIATDAVGAAAGGLVQHGKTGLIVQERDASALSEALTTLLVNEKLRMEMSAETRKVVAKWSNHEMVDGFARAIDYALATKG
jgi:glycosyltransferase involved in cell wall biosynthesis